MKQNEIKRKIKVLKELLGKLKELLSNVNQKEITEPVKEWLKSFNSALNNIAKIIDVAPTNHLVEIEKVLDKTATKIFSTFEEKK